jgi:FG-GAP repeat
MRRVAWVVVVVLAVAALAVPAWEPALAQPATVPTSDFDHDGFGDLAVGVPGETVGGRAGAGAVGLVLAGDSGFTGAGGQLFHQGAGGVPGAVEPGDRFGAALSAPFFHGTDVLEDLGAGAPGETVAGRAAAGAGTVLFGDGGGLGAGGSQFLHQGIGGLGGAPEPGDVFGAALG